MKEFYSSKAVSLKRMRLDKSGSYHPASQSFIWHSFYDSKAKESSYYNFRRRCRAKNELYFSLE
ncbi:unnamed protein product [Acanthoscelides obtectus]|uniref:Uncharacterized protein n=1 Tax=Acanthoscelides obtectus TaxID=200917 RepID=A0A9P0PGM7_ACAOB|nr:unnamed protein product [Acanthoscelides obtectus]CAK1630416.1 hypothetical protein AOBTE_LOCUS6313 [Acanthoscelides obtectus]